MDLLQAHLQNLEQFDPEGIFVLKDASGEDIVPLVNNVTGADLEEEALLRDHSLSIQLYYYSNINRHY